MNILDWIYPPTCISCRRALPVNRPASEKILLCNSCIPLFEKVAPPICDTCGIPVESGIHTCAPCRGKSFHFSKNHATFLYQDVLRDLLHELKFRNKKQIAHGLGQLWAAALKDHPFPENTCLVPLPMHKKKRRERGFNQADILATELSLALNIPLAKIITRTLDTPPQSAMHPSLRAENVDGVFSLTQEIDPAKNYIIIDDIYTSGASLNECAKILKNAGAASVDGMTLAIVEKKTVRGFAPDTPTRFLKKAGQKL